MITTPLRLLVRAAPLILLILWPAPPGDLFSAESTRRMLASDGVRLAQLSAAQKCPNPYAMALYKHDIAYQRAEELNPFYGLSRLNIKVWQRGSQTGFYVNDRLHGFAEDIRQADVFGEDGPKGGGSCSVDTIWQECVARFAGVNDISSVATTCSFVLDLRAIPAWKPSPNDQTKQDIATELREEIERKWPRVEQIVVRDFNVQDSQITMYLKTPDGDYYQGCGFSAARKPHCDSWHLFGHAPTSTIRARVFEKPYRLK